MAFPQIDREGMKQLAKEAAREAVQETLVSLGIEVSDPIAAQETFARMRKMTRLMESDRFERNLLFLDRWASNTEKVVEAGWKSTATFVVSSGLAFIAFVTKDWWLMHFRG